MTKRPQIVGCPRPVHRPVRYSDEWHPGPSARARTWRRFGWLPSDWRSGFSLEDSKHWYGDLCPFIQGLNPLIRRLNPPTFTYKNGVIGLVQGVFPFPETMHFLPGCVRFSCKVSLYRILGSWGYDNCHDNEHGGTTMLQNMWTLTRHSYKAKITVEFLLHQLLRELGVPFQPTKWWYHVSSERTQETTAGSWKCISPPIKNSEIAWPTIAVPLLWFLCFRLFLCLWSYCYCTRWTSINKSRRLLLSGQNKHLIYSKCMVPTCPA